MGDSDTTLASVRCHDGDHVRTLSMRSADGWLTWCPRSGLTLRVSAPQPSCPLGHALAVPFAAKWACPVGQAFAGT